MNKFLFEMDSVFCVSVTVTASCYTAAVKQFCLIFGDSLPMSHVSSIKKLK